MKISNVGIPETGRIASGTGSIDTTDRKLFGFCVNLWFILCILVLSVSSGWTFLYSFIINNGR